jgi:hypothetical protein
LARVCGIDIKDFIVDEVNTIGRIKLKFADMVTVVIVLASKPEIFSSFY